MPQEPFFGNWEVAIAEAAEVAGVTDLDEASFADLSRAWDLVCTAADLSVEELAAKVAEEAELATADFGSAHPHAPQLVPGELARRRTVMPLRCTDKELVIATCNPLSQDAKREVAAIASRRVVFEIAPPATIEAAILEAYGEPAEDEAPAVAPPDQVKPGGPHVLVVDDEAGARALFRSVLEEGGFRVTLAKDGPEAIRILEGEERFDLVTLDYYMNEMNGLRVLQQVRSHNAHGDMPVIMVTGADDRRIEMSLFEAGADDFIVKPIDPPLFTLRIQAALRRRQLG